LQIEIDISLQLLQLICRYNCSSWFEAFFRRTYDAIKTSVSWILWKVRIKFYLC